MNFMSAMTIVCVVDAANAPVPAPVCSTHTNETKAPATSVLAAAFDRDGVFIYFLNDA
jgi:hypothetical protein